MFYLRVESGYLGKLESSNLETTQPLNYLYSANMDPFSLPATVIPATEVVTSVIASIANAALSASGHIVIVRTRFSLILQISRLVAPISLKFSKATPTSAANCSGVAGISVRQSVIVIYTIISPFSHVSN